MKITILALHLGFGGIEQYITTLANILSNQNDVEIITTYRLSDKPAFKLSNRVNVQYLLNNWKPNKTELMEAVKSKNPFKILMEGSKSVILLILKSSKNKKAIKNCQSDIVITTRDFHNLLVQKYANKKIVKIATEHNHHNNNQKYIKKLVKSCYKFDYFVPISFELTKFYAELLPNVKVLHIPFCIEFPKNIDYCPTSKHLISVGRLSQEKGFGDLIDIFECLHRHDNELRLSIVGDGDEYKFLEDKIIQHGLSECITLTGFLKREEVNKLYRKSSLYLMTSFTESFGIVLLEAMSFGIPCIAFNSAQGATEIIEDGKNGVLVSNRNKDVFVKKVRELLENSNSMNSFSHNAIESIAKYRYDDVRKQWLSFIDEIAEERVK